MKIKEPITISRWKLLIKSGSGAIIRGAEINQRRE
jgi:hypothetical protein